MAFTHCQSSDPQRPQACQGLRQILQGHGLLDLGEGQPPQHGPGSGQKTPFLVGNIGSYTGDADISWLKYGMLGQLWG